MMMHGRPRTNQSNIPRHAIRNGRPSTKALKTRTTNGSTTAAGLDSVAKTYKNVGSQNWATRACEGAEDELNAAARDFVLSARLRPRRCRGIFGSLLSSRAAGQV